MDSGASAYIYVVEDQIVLKSPMTCVLPRDDSYALLTVFYYEHVPILCAILNTWN